MSRGDQSAPRPVRVLHLRDSPWVDGPGRTILETASRIDRSRVDYSVGALVADPDRPHPLVEALRSRGQPVFPIADAGGAGREIVGRIVGLLDRLHIDVLHTSEFRSNVLGLLCRRQRPVKLVSTAHGWIANDLRGKAYTLVDRLLLRQFDHVLLVSHATRRRLPSWWVPESRVTVLHNALMTESYGRELLDAPRRLPDPAKDVRLLNVGRLSPEKGQDLLLQAVAALASEYPGLKLTFAGNGPLEETLRRMAAGLGISERVHFAGYVADMPALYAASDLVVQSSHTEGLPNVILEAAYLGAPMIATDVGGTREVIEHGVSGWLIEAGSVTTLVENVRRFLAQPATFLAMASRGRSRIESEFSYSARTETQTRLYQEVACRAG